MSLIFKDLALGELLEVIGEGEDYFGSGRKFCQLEKQHLNFSKLFPGLNAEC
jgi:hypothetical protein